MTKYHTAQLLLQWTVGAMLLAILLRTWLVMGLVEPVVVAGSSMSPTLGSGDPLWIDRTTFQRRQPRRWEVVVARNPHDGAELCVKRVVGLPGESIEIHDGELWIDGRLVVKPSELPDSLARSWIGGNLAPVRLRADEYFVVGDNGPVSLDSRRWGPLPARLLLGKPLGVR